MERQFANSLEKLVQQLEKLPGIGPKTAQRLAYHIMKSPVEEARELGQAILEAREKLKICSKCYNFSESDPCPICSDTKRDKKLVCVVEDPNDMILIEKSGSYKGMYHVLLGAISPPEGVSPNHIRIKELVTRVEKESIQEVILATNPTMRGDATAMYISEKLKKYNVKITRIASGIPVGGDLEYMDQVTISRAMEGRQEI